MQKYFPRYINPVRGQLSVISCQIGLSDQTTFRSDNCQIGQLSDRTTVSGDNCQWGQLSVAQLSVETVSAFLALGCLNFCGLFSHSSDSFL